MTSIRANYQDSPEGRIAFAAYELFEDFFQEFAETGAGPQFPHAADLVERLQPYVTLELLNAQIKVAERFGTFAFVQELMAARELLKRRIDDDEAKRK